ncbi:MAG: methyltransferase domain-containing protein [Dehalococcoidia bacterium]
MDRHTAEATLRPAARDALDAWRALVEADAEQVGRISELALDADYYAPMAPRFRPGARDSEELPVLEALLRPEDTLLDIGAGGGRLAIPLAAKVRRVVAVEPSAAMRETLAGAALEAGVSNIEIHPDRWPDSDAAGDVAMAVHAIYDIADLGSWLEGMERAASRLCVVVLFDRARGHAWSEIFEAVHGESMAALPAVREFLAVLGALERPFEVRTIRSNPIGPTPEDAAFVQARRICWLNEGSDADRRLQAFLRARYPAPEGTLAMPPMRRAMHIVTWEPPR